MILYFTRHGETEWNTASRMQGSSDSPLTARGIAQAETLVPWARSLPLDRVYTSPQPRALQTARIALGDCAIPLILESRLQEASLGAFEGRTFQEAGELYPETMDHFLHHPEQFQPAGVGGETFFQVRERVESFLSELTERGEESILLVSHALILLMIRVLILDLPIQSLRETSRHATSCCRCHAEYNAGRWTLLSFGEPVDEKALH